MYAKFWAASHQNTRLNLPYPFEWFDDNVKSIFALINVS